MAPGACTAPVPGRGEPLGRPRALGLDREGPRTFGVVRPARLARGGAIALGGAGARVVARAPIDRAAASGADRRRAGLARGPVRRVALDGVATSPAHGVSPR